MSKMTILMGNIASGKSTYALQIVPTSEYIYVINQDILGNRNKCLEKAEFYLKLPDFDIIIDRTNISKKQRNYWISLAKKYNAEVHLIEFVCTPEKCLERALNRKDHPTIKNMDKSKIESIIKKFGEEYEAPTMDEGFSSHITIDTSHL